MNTKNNLPDYSELFGNIDFKEGDKSRSVFSPAAYLADMLQLLEDEFVLKDDDKNALDYRRADIRDILLDEENTFTLIPYLDIVIEALENKVQISKSDVQKLLNYSDHKFQQVYSDILSETVVVKKIKTLLNIIIKDDRDYRDIQRLSDADLKALHPSLKDVGDVKNILLYTSRELVYQALKEANYPFNMPFDISNEEIKLYLKYLDISPEKLHKLFAERKNNRTLTREYLGLSHEDYQFFIKGHFTQDEIRKAYNYKGNAFIKDMANVTNFMTATGLSGLETRKLLFQNLYRDFQTVEFGQSQFFINAGVDGADGYAIFDAEEENIVWKGNNTNIPILWFANVNRFIRLSKKTGLGFADLDLILRQLCSNLIDDKDSPEERLHITLNADSLQTIAIVKKLHETLELAIDEVVALLSTLPEMGQGVDKEPADLFNRTFNNPCTRIDKTYLLNRRPAAYKFALPEFNEITYADDLYSEANDLFRKRLIHVLGISKLDLQKITYHLSCNEVDDSLWMKASRKSDLINFMYRFTKLSNALDISHPDLFNLFDILGKDPSIAQMDQHQVFIHNTPSTQNCYEIILYNSLADKRQTKDLIWLVQILQALSQWMQSNGMDTNLFWHISTGKFRTTKEKDAALQMKISSLDTLYQAIKPLLFSAESLAVDPFDERTAKIIYQTANELFSKNGLEGNGLVPMDMELLKKIALESIFYLDQITHHDFKGLNIEEKLLNKLFNNLVDLAYIDSEGRILETEFPKAQADFFLETDYSNDRKDLFLLIHNMYKEEEEKGFEEVELNLFPSDLDALEYTDEQLSEVYSNLVFNNYIDEEGVVQHPHFFADPENHAEFDINININDHAEAVFNLLDNQLKQFQESEVILKKNAFDELPFSEGEKKELFENLRFNGYIDTSGKIVDKLRMLNENISTFSLALKFYPHRHEILQAIKRLIEKDRSNYLFISKSMLKDIAENIVSEWTYQDLQEEFLNGGIVMEEAKSFFMDEKNKKDFVLSYYFDGLAGNVIFDRIASIITFSNMFRFTAANLSGMGFSEEDHINLHNSLVGMGYLTPDAKIPLEKLAYFLNPDNAILFNVEAFKDYNKDVFFQLLKIATAIRDASEAIVSRMSDIAELQEATVLDQLQSIFGVSADVMKSLSEEVFMDPVDIKSSWLIPVLKVANAMGKVTTEPTDYAFNVAYKRIMQFAGLANKLELSKEEVEIAFRDQSLVAKFPEKLHLPEGVDAFDALLEGEGFIYLFKGDRYFIYRSKDYKLVDRSDLKGDDEEIIKIQDEDESLRMLLQKDPIKELYEHQTIEKVDAAFRDKNENLYIVSGTHYHVMIKGSEVWDKRRNEFGNINNSFESVTSVDSAYKDAEGRLFLFANDHYIRYSDKYDFIDEGYPKLISEDWDKENQDIELPKDFQSEPDAAFEGSDGKTYFFKGHQFICSDNYSHVMNVRDFWGKTENYFKGANGIDAAYSTPGAYYLFAGENIIKYVDSIENKEVRVVEGFPKKIAEFFREIPADFAKGLDAAFRGVDGNIHLFKDDETLALNDKNLKISQPKIDIPKRWGIIQNSISETGRIDAVLTGLDGITYVFCQNQYFRYSGNSYKMADEGYPRLITQDWAGLKSVDAAFVLDGKTYLFGKDTENNDIYVRYSTSNYTKLDSKDEDKKEFVTVKPNRPDIEEIEVFPREQSDTEWWSFPVNFVEKGISKVDAVMNMPNDKVYLFSGNRVIEYDHAHRWWSEPMLLEEKWDGLPKEFKDDDISIDAAFAGKDGYSYIFYGNKYVRFSRHDFSKVDNGYPKTINKFWGKIKNNIEKNCKVDAAFVVESYLPTTISFNHKEDRIVIPHSRNALPFNKAFSIELWINPLKFAKAKSEPVSLLEKEGVLKVSLDKQGFVSIHQKDELILTSTNRLKVNSWSHLGISHDGQQLTLYFDEVTSQVDTPLFGNNSKPIIIGNPGEEDGFIGFIDDIRFWNVHRPTGLMKRFEGVQLSGNENGLLANIGMKMNKVADFTGKLKAIETHGLSPATEEESSPMDVLNGPMHTYLIADDQYYRYQGAQYDFVEPGYPRNISALKDEPRFSHLGSEFAKEIDAAFADLRNIYLFKDGFCHVISDKASTRQIADEIHEAGSTGVKSKIQVDNLQLALIDNGRMYVSDGKQWYHLSNLDGTQVFSRAASPAFMHEILQAKAEDTLRSNYKKGLNTVLKGVDGNTYLFKEDKYFDLALNKEFETGEQWGNVRNNISINETVDAAFAGRDGKTYVFSGDQFFQYTTKTYVGKPVEKAPKPISKYWNGLKSVALAYVKEEKTYLFEKASPSGTFRYVRYSDDEYFTPDAGYPKTADTSFWGMPEKVREEGFDNFDTVFCDETSENLIFLKDKHFVSYNIKADKWSYPKMLDTLYDNIPFNKTTFKSLKTAFIGSDGSTYFFSDECYVVYKNGKFGEIKPVKGDWGIVRNKFATRTDASFVDMNGKTYLFSGDEYVRYSTDDYRYVDDEYPKMIARDLPNEDDFKMMPKEFWYEINELEEKKAPVFITAVVGNQRSLYVFTNKHLHISTRSYVGSYNLSGMGKVKNNFLENGKVDAAFVNNNGLTFLFSGDQYIRYSKNKYHVIDEGYPKSIAESFAPEIGLNSLPAEYICDLDAAFAGNDGVVYLFKNHYFISSTNGESRPIHSFWGKINNIFTNNDEDRTIDGAVVDKQGRLYVFKRDQFIRYSSTDELFSEDEEKPKYIDQQYPLKIEDNWPRISVMLQPGGQDFRGIKGAFTFEDRLYFWNDFFESEAEWSTPRYVMYTSVEDKDPEKTIYPQKFKDRWGDFSDYLVSDIMLITRFKSLQEMTSGSDVSLTQFLYDPGDDVQEPYVAFAEMFDFDKDEVRWLKRRNAFLSASNQINQYELQFDLELVVRIYDILKTTNRINVEVHTLYNNGWLHLYGNQKDYKAAARGIYEMLGAIDCNNNYETLFSQIRDELNTIKRDALVPYVISMNKDISDARDLYEHLLVDIEMESCADTSRIVEAIAAVQLYLHRYFINLEELDIKGSNDEEVREKLKERWQWMKNYRVWEANRKVFLYPENYIRPELRDTKTPPFKTLEEDLLQGEITTTAVERAYKKYLDEYTEVSRLKISGGYMFDSPGTQGTDKKLVLFGRTKTDPIRYYYRFGNFINGESDSAKWDPWLPLNISIESPKVYPVYAFNRVFVFWATVEKLIEEVETSQLKDEKDGDTHNLSAGENRKYLRYKVNVFYSFYNLNEEWTQPQQLNTTFEENDENTNELKIEFPITSVELFVEYSDKLKDGENEYEHDNIIISCKFNKREFTFSWNPISISYNNILVHKAYRLTPELYTKPAVIPEFDNRGKDVFKALFDEGNIEDRNVMMLNTIENSIDGQWFAYDHKGGSFLVKPDTPTLDDSWPRTLPDETFNLKEGINAAVYHSVEDEGGETEGTTYFFRGSKYFTDKDPSPKNIKYAWGREFNNLTSTGRVDGVFTDDKATYFFSGDECYRYAKNKYDLVQSVKKLNTDNLELGLPLNWKKIDAAVNSVGENETYLFNGTQYAERKKRIIDFNTPSAIKDRWGKIDPLNYKVNVTTSFTYKNSVYVLSGTKFLKFKDQKYIQVEKVIKESGTTLADIINELNPETNWGEETNLKDFTVEATYQSTGEDQVNFLLKNKEGEVHGLMNFDGAKISANASFEMKDHKNWTAACYIKESKYLYGFEGNVMHVFKDGKRVQILGKPKPSVRRNIQAALFGLGDDENIYFMGRNRYIKVPKNSTPEVVYGAILGWKDAELITSEDVSKIQNNIQKTGKVEAAYINADNQLFLFNGDQYVRYSSIEGGYDEFIDKDYPKKLSTNTEGLPQWTSMGAGVRLKDGKSYFFNDKGKYVTSDDLTTLLDVNAKWGIVANNFTTTGLIDAAYTHNGRLFITSGNQFMRYSSATPENSTGDAGYPKPVEGDHKRIDAAFKISGNTLYVFSGNRYAKMENGALNNLGKMYPIKGNWGNIPLEFKDGLDAAFKKGPNLYFFKGKQYIVYDTDGEKPTIPYEITEAPYEIVRLTTSTADQLNQLLFAKGINGLLNLRTQEIDEIPSFTLNNSSPTNISIRKGKFKDENLPFNTHLDFKSANGIYYWEVFFHTPYLIAQSLNGDQKFEEAKKWFEYIFDPTQLTNYWRFLPFLAVDIDAIIRSAGSELNIIKSKLSQATVSSFNTALKGLKEFDDEFQGESSFPLKVDGSFDLSQLNKAIKEINNSGIGTEVENFLKKVTKTTPAENVNAAQQLMEVLDIIKKLPARYRQMLNTPAQIDTYLNDPFDPHAIADLRKMAYRKAIVMSYIDNLLDWGDMLFRQYTRESIGEARMCYVLAYDLLGHKPANLGTKVLSAPKRFEDLSHYSEEYDFLLELENGAPVTSDYESLSFAGTIHDSIVNPYFYVPENELFIEYWERVEDRLHKIRHCLNIMGIKQPLPLFQPPIDPMALVQAVAGGGGFSAAMAAMNIGVPHYRFNFMLNKAKDLVNKLNQFGADLLNTLEKKDAEELSILQTKQEGNILGYMTQIKEKQIEDAEFNINMLQESKRSAEEQKQHYEGLQKAGLLPEESAQMTMMAAAAAIHGLTAIAKIVSGLSYIIPQFTVGLFSFGATSGGRNVGAMLEEFSEAPEKVAEALELGGESAGIYAQYKRSFEDWQLQEKMAESEIKQLELQIQSAQIQKAIAQRELMIHQKEIENNASILKFMTTKFSNVQLYSWMSGKLSGLFYQTYKMAHDMAKQAEKSFQFETGTKEADINFIGGMYWDSQRKGLLSGESLGHDLDRMEKAFIEQDSRNFEITKSISMLELDPLAFLKLKTEGVCEFRLTEALFDYDYPGHYNRQITTISVAFDIGEGQTVNATLTQLNNKVVMEPDIKAVKYLLNPKDEQPDTIRSDWKPNQQIALSFVDQYTENNGLFELRFDNDRYLPFEGTGAVSLWRLELNGKKGSYNPDDLLDVTIKLRYTSDQGGSSFGNAVKSALKPYHATSFFDLAYSFTDEWNEYMLSDEKDLNLTFTRDMFPGMASSKILGVFLKYDYVDDKKTTFVMNDELELKNLKYFEIGNLGIPTDGATWKFTAKGDKSNIKNVEMVLVYKAKV